MLPGWLPSPRGTENYVRLPSDQKDNQSLQTKRNSPYSLSGRKEAAFAAIRKIGIYLTPPFGGSRHLTRQKVTVTV
jgi:hypothetical protein